MQNKPLFETLRTAERDVLYLVCSDCGSTIMEIKKEHERIKSDRPYFCYTCHPERKELLK